MRSPRGTTPRTDWANLMLALYRLGRQAESLAAYQRARQVLADELGTEPSRELQRLNEQILRRDPSLGLSEPARQAVRPSRLDRRPGSLDSRAASGRGAARRGERDRARLDVLGAGASAVGSHGRRQPSERHFLIHSRARPSGTRSPNRVSARAATSTSADPGPGRRRSSQCGAADEAGRCAH
jgi:Bacterial transcriptional activator domain